MELYTDTNHDNNQRQVQGSKPDDNTKGVNINNIIYDTDSCNESEEESTIQEETRVDGRNIRAGNYSSVMWNQY